LYGKGQLGYSFLLLYFAVLISIFVPMLRYSTADPWVTTISLIDALAVSVNSLMFFYLVFFKRKNKLIPMKFDFFNDITHGGIPEPSMVMVSGDPGSGKTLLCEELLFRDLQEGKPWIYVTHSDTPVNIRKRLKSFKHDMTPYEVSERFIIIDCYSSLANAQSTEKRSVDRPYDLTQLTIAIMDAARSLPKNFRVLIDSTTPLFNTRDPSSVVTFLHEIGARIKAYDGVLYFTAVTDGIPKDVVKRLEEISDCVIEARMREEKGNWTRWLRVKKMTGRRFLERPIQFEIVPEKGFIFYTEKKFIKNPSAF